MDENENIIPKCVFTTEYYDYHEKIDKPFICDQEPLKNKKLCLFHDEGYLKDSSHPENKDKVNQKLYERIDRCISNNDLLYCIGYHLSDIKINKKFAQDVYFNHCKFQNANLLQAIFSAVADFTNAKFSGNANFTLAKFSALTGFIFVEFSAGADFSYITFSESSFFRHV